MSMLFWFRLLSALIALLPIITPGILVVRAFKKKSAIDYIARVILWSLTVSILGTFLLSVLHLPILWYLPVMALFLIGGAVNILRRKNLLSARKQVLSIAAIGLFAYLLFSIPFFYIQNGLPAGDSQKAIYWANQIILSNKIPDYQSAIANLSRDPVDFFTPGLHSVTALVMASSPLPLTAVGLFSIVLGLVATIIALAISRLLYDKQYHLPLAFLTTFFVLTQYRFLRYFSEPGYHLQNIVGEVLLFGSIYIALSSLKHWRWGDSILLGLLLAALALTHQFSAFIAAFALLPIASVFVLSKFEWRRETIVKQLVPPLAAILVIVLLATALGLYKKIPHIFTTTPHLSDTLPSLLDYPKLMGLPWFVIGMAGLVVTLVIAIRFRHTNKAVLGFSLSTIVLLLLSQGPRIFIDIPAVRALLYLAIPLSITGAYFVNLLLNQAQKITFVGQRYLLLGAVLAIVIGVGSTSLTQAFSISRNVRTDASLTPALDVLNALLYRESSSAGVLTDGYNQQATSWLLLSGKPTYTRVSSDLARQISEAGQSSLRNRLYLDQLDFDKVFALGSLPEITNILDKHNIQWVAGINKSSEYSLAHNPALKFFAKQSNVTIFTTEINEPSRKITTISPWLLRASTLANDIGDEEDTFEHLQASLRADRLSGPQFDGVATYRTTSSPFIPLQFNVRDYVSALWDKENTGQADSGLQFEIRFTKRPTSLNLRTNDGSVFPVSGNDVTIQIPAALAKIDSRGFITFLLENPSQQLVGIDLIALGLSQVP